MFRRFGGTHVNTMRMEAVRIIETSGHLTITRCIKHNHCLMTYRHCYYWRCVKTCYLMLCSWGWFVFRRIVKEFHIFISVHYGSLIIIHAYKVTQLYQIYNTYVLTSFPLGSFSLCFQKYLSFMAYCTIPVLDIPTFYTSSALPRPLSRESWSCKPVI
jgi:hypothetical protein